MCFHVSLRGPISSLSDSFQHIQFTCGQLSYTAFKADAGFAVTKTLQLVKFTLRPPGSLSSSVSSNNVVRSILQRPTLERKQTVRQRFLRFQLCFIMVCPEITELSCVVLLWLHCVALQESCLCNNIPSCDF